MKALNYTTNTNEIATQLKGATVRYLANKSSITKNGVRVFKIEEVEDIGFSKKENKMFVTVKCFDIDDSGESKYRTLQVAGIELVVWTVASRMGATPAATLPLMQASC